MNRLFFILFLAFNLSCYSQTQAEMNKTAYAEYNIADKQLNEIYQTILSKYSSDTLFVKNLKKSQRIWIQFRDAEMEMKFPEYAKGTYGSIQPTCNALYLKELITKRIETLKKWISTTEGDVCSGSVRHY